MSNEEQTTTGTSSPARRPWEPMSLAKVGTFGDALRGSSGAKGDGGISKRP